MPKDPVCGQGSETPERNVGRKHDVKHAWLVERTSGRMGFWWPSGIMFRTRDEARQDCECSNQAGMGVTRFRVRKYTRA